MVPDPREFDHANALVMAIDVTTHAETMTMAEDSADRVLVGCISSLSACFGDARSRPDRRPRPDQSIASAPSQRRLLLKHRQELCEPGRMRGPRRRRHQHTVGQRLINRNTRPLRACERDFWATRRIARALAALQDIGCGEQLNTVANSRDGLSRPIE